MQTLTVNENEAGQRLAYSLGKNFNPAAKNLPH